MSSDEISIYVHWPFCLSKCPYCDFNSHVRDNVDLNKYSKAYLKEISYFSYFLKNKKISTVFFGGGTPSLMPANLVEKILNSLGKNSSLSSDAEITLEANPTSYETSKFKEFKKIGINRVSLGIQSLRDTHLKFLGREHSVKDALKAIESASSIFYNYNIDLMYSLPNQSRNEWIEDLSRAISYSGKHISLYQLTIEKGTRFFSDYRNKKFSMPNENLSKNMYTDTVEFLENKNIRQYEISNFAMPGYECKHNLGYWKYKSYLGIGAGAHSRLHLENNIVKTVVMEHSPENWLNSVSLNGNAIQSECILDDKEVATEKVIMGLRQFDGINLKEIGDFINKSNMNHCIKAGFLNFEKNKLHLTKKGTLVLNSIIESLLT